MKQVGAEKRFIFYSEWGEGDDDVGAKRRLFDWQKMSTSSTSVTSMLTTTTTTSSPFIEATTDADGSEFSEKRNHFSQPSHLPLSTFLPLPSCTLASLLGHRLSFRVRCSWVWIPATYQIYLRASHLLRWVFYEWTRLCKSLCICWTWASYLFAQVRGPKAGTLKNKVLALH